MNLKLKQNNGNIITSGFDWFLFTAMIIELSFGILMIYSTSFNDNQLLNNLFVRQLGFALLGIVGFFIISRLDYKVFAQVSGFLYFLVIVLLVVTFVWGLTTRGSTRWIDFGALRLQPSEFIKPVLISVLAFYYASREKITFKNFIFTFIITAIPAALIFRQPDLGSALVIMGTWLVMSVIAGVSWKYLLTLMLVGMVLLPFGYQNMHDYQKERLAVFINPQADALGAGYNIIQAIIAVGSGEITGRGFGRGTQSHLNFLPEQHTDFIFATLAEELGFLGTTLVVVIFALMMIRLLLIARGAPDQYGMLLVGGIATLILLQLFINIGMNLGLLPVTGITLPFISYGGSSLLAMILSLGIVEAVARHKREDVILIR